MFVMCLIQIIYMAAAVSERLYSKRINEIRSEGAKLLFQSDKATDTKMLLILCTVASNECICAG